MRVFSRSFVDLVQQLSGRRLKWREVISNDDREWLELVGGDQVREVIPKNKSLSGWRCVSCGIARVLAYKGSDAIRHHVAVGDFTAALPGIFSIKHLRGINLGMTDDLWSRVKMEPEAKGLTSDAVGLVLKREVSRLSQLMSYEAYQANPQPVPS